MKFKSLIISVLLLVLPQLIYAEDVSIKVRQFDSTGCNYFAHKILELKFSLQKSNHKEIKRVSVINGFEVLHHDSESLKDPQQIDWWQQSTTLAKQQEKGVWVAERQHEVDPTLSPVAYKGVQFTWRIVFKDGSVKYIRNNKNDHKYFQASLKGLPLFCSRNEAKWQLVSLDHQKNNLAIE